VPPRAALLCCASERRRHRAIFTMGSSRGFLMISSHVFGVRKKVFGQVFNRENNTNFANLRDPFLRLLGLL
jgi:hypothetical protein